MIQKLNKNNNCYCGDTIDIDVVVNDCIDKATNFGWVIERLSVPSEKELVVFKKIPKTPKKRVYISAGIHGDEPAGPVTVLELLSKNEWPDNIEFHIFPCLNPLGFKKNTRENENSIDLNRDYYHCNSPEISAHIDWLERSPAYDLTLCLHEDWEAKGFYLYESLHPEHRSIANQILDGVRPFFSIDDSPEIDGYEATNGIIGAPIDHHTLKHWPEALYLFEKKKLPNYTLETSSDFPLEARVNAMCVAVETAIRSLVTI